MIDTHTTHVFLKGDTEPLVTTLPTEEVLARVFEVVEMEMETDGFGWVRLPLEDRPDALVRPRAISALVPYLEEDDKA
jgi:hypothetical protein